jgi:hypothetical protein
MRLRRHLPSHHHAASPPYRSMRHPLSAIPFPDRTLATKQRIPRCFSALAYLACACIRVALMEPCIGSRKHHECCTVQSVLTPLLSCRHVRTYTNDPDYGTSPRSHSVRSVSRGLPQDVKVVEARKLQQATQHCQAGVKLAEL